MTDLSAVRPGVRVLRIHDLREQKMPTLTQGHEGMVESSAGGSFDSLGRSGFQGSMAREVSITSGRPQAVKKDFSYPDCAVAAQAAHLPGASSLAAARETKAAKAEQHLGEACMTGEKLHRGESTVEEVAEAAKAAAAMAEVGERTLRMSSSVDGTTSESEQADDVDITALSNSDGSCDEGNHLQQHQCRGGVLSFNSSVFIPPARKLSRSFSGKRKHVRGYGHQRYSNPQALSAIAQNDLYWSQGSASSPMESRDISTEDWSEAFEANSDSVIHGDEVHTDSDGSSCDSDSRNTGIICMMRFRSMGSLSSIGVKANGDVRDPRRRRQQLKKKKRNTQHIRPRSRGFPEGIPAPACRPGMRGNPGVEAEAVTPVEEVWRGLAARHQLMLDRWPRKDIGGEEPDPVVEGGKARGAPSNEGRRLIEEWLRCSGGSTRVCAARLRRLTNGRASWGWREGRLLARDVADALLTGAIKLLPGGPRGSGCLPPPNVLLVHTRLIDHERCPPEQYHKCISYLLQTLGENHRRAAAAAAAGGKGREKACPEAIVVIDARWDTVGAKVKKILNFLIGGGGVSSSSSSSSEGGRGGSPQRRSEEQCGEMSGASWDATVDSGKGKLPLCDPALSLRPVRIRKLLIVHAGAMLKAMLIPRRVSLSSATSPPRVEVEDYDSGVTSIICGRTSPSGRRANSSTLTRVAVGSRSFLALSGWSSREWVRREAGEDIARCLPIELGGDLDLRRWSWEGWVERRIQREDLMESTVNPLDKSLAPGACRFLDACHALAESPGVQDYARVLCDALDGGLSVPVTWVKRTLCDVVQARDAHEPPWRGRTGGSTRGAGGSGRGGEGSRRWGSDNISPLRRGLSREWNQLWKDMGRDIVEICGERIDLTADGQGFGGGGGGSMAGNPEVVLAPLAREIARVGAEGGLVGMSEVQCFLAARDIMLSTKRTSSGGDVWTCVDRLCGRRDLVVVCPASHEADPLRLAVEFESELDHDAIPSRRLNLERDVRSSITAPLSPSPSLPSPCNNSPLARESRHQSRGEVDEEQNHHHHHHQQEDGSPFRPNRRSGPSTLPSSFCLPLWESGGGHGSEIGSGCGERPRPRSPLSATWSGWNCQELDVADGGKGEEGVPAGGGEQYRSLFRRSTEEFDKEKRHRGLGRSDCPEALRGEDDDAGNGTPRRLSPSRSQPSLSPSSPCFFPPSRPRSPSLYAEQTTNSLSGDELEGPCPSPEAGAALQSIYGPSPLCGRRRRPFQAVKGSRDAQGTNCATTTAAAGGCGFSWGVIGSSSPGSRHSSFHEIRRGMRDSSRRSVASNKGCVRVAVTTAMSYKICDANPMNEDDAVIRVVNGVFEHVFRVRASGAVEGLQPIDGNPIVRLKSEN